MSIAVFVKVKRRIHNVRLDVNSVTSFQSSHNTLDPNIPGDRYKQYHVIGLIRSTHKATQQWNRNVK